MDDNPTPAADAESEEERVHRLAAERADAITGARLLIGSAVAFSRTDSTDAIRWAGLRAVLAPDELAQLERRVDQHGADWLHGTFDARVSLALESQGPSAITTARARAFGHSN